MNLSFPVWIFARQSALWMTFAAAGSALAAEPPGHVMRNGILGRMGSVVIRVADHAGKAALRIGGDLGRQPATKQVTTSRQAGRDAAFGQTTYDEATFQPVSVTTGGVLMMPNATRSDASRSTPANIRTTYRPGEPVSKISLSDYPSPGVSAEPSATIRSDALAVKSAASDMPVLTRRPSPPTAPAGAKVYPFAVWQENQQVKSPYPPHNLLDVSGLVSGSLAKDPTTGRIFRLP